MLDLISDFIAQHQLGFHTFVIIASLAIIVKAADYLVTGITNYSEKLGLSDYIIGMIVVALAASVPELVSSIMGLAVAKQGGLAAAKHGSGIIFGTIIGSNIAGIALVLAIFALVGRKINLKSKVLAKTEMVVFLFSIVPFLLVADGILSRLDGSILVLLYLAFTVFLWRKEGELGRIKKQVKLKRIYKDALLFILALVAILLSARWLVFSAIAVSKELEITTYYISLIVIGIGATIPDMTVGIRALLKGHLDVGIGDVLGSMLIKSLLFLGIIAMIKPLAISFNLLLIAITFTIIIRGITFYFTEKGFMNWKHGLLMLLLYIAFIVIESLKGGM